MEAKTQILDYQKLDINSSFGKLQCLIYGNSIRLMNPSGQYLTLKGGKTFSADICWDIIDIDSFHLGINDGAVYICMVRNKPVTKKQRETILTEFNQLADKTLKANQNLVIRARWVEKHNASIEAQEKAAEKRKELYEAMELELDARDEYINFTIAHKEICNAAFLEYYPEKGIEPVLGKIFSSIEKPSGT